MIAQPSEWHRTWPLSGGPILRLTVWHLGDGRWWDTQGGSWRDGRERFTCAAIGVADVLRQVRTTRVVLATAHRDTANNRDSNLAAFCQR